MKTDQYEIRFLGLGGFDAPELQQEIGPDARIIRHQAPDAAHGDLALLTIGFILGSRALTAALLYFGRKSTKSQFTLTVQVAKPDGTVITTALKFDTQSNEGLSDQAIRQLAGVLKISPTDLLGTE